MQKITVCEIDPKEKIVTNQFDYNIPLFPPEALTHLCIDIQTEGACNDDCENCIINTLKNAGNKKEITKISSKPIRYAHISVSIHGLETDIESLKALTGWIRIKIKDLLTGKVKDLFNFRDDFVSDLEVELEETA